MTKRDALAALKLALPRPSAVWDWPYLVGLIERAVRLGELAPAFDQAAYGVSYALATGRVGSRGDRALRSLSGREMLALVAELAAAGTMQSEIARELNARYSA